MAKRSIKPSNGLVPLSQFQVNLTSVVPPRPKQHAVLINPVGFSVTRSRVVAGIAAAMTPASAKPSNG